MSVYFNSLDGLKLVAFDTFWFLFPIHKWNCRFYCIVGVPLLLLYIKNKLFAKETDRYSSKQIIECCEKALLASEFKTD